jgi:cytochrome c oxidase subunit II
MMALLQADGGHSVLHPASAHARDVVHLWWWMFWVAAVVWLIVSIMAVLGARHRHDAGSEVPDVYPDPVGEQRAKRNVFVATLFTAAILIAFMGFDMAVGRAESNHGHAADANGMIVKVVGHQWWWEFVYEDSDPSRRMLTANELHVPVGRPVTLRLESPDVIHSFWLPNVTGKQDAVPGYHGSLTFIPDSAGVYRGLCAEFCGEQHAKMQFIVVAEPLDKFRTWYAAAMQPSYPPTDSLRAEGLKVFLSGPCATCHAIDGTPARATVGPILTHFGSRRTLASGARANLPGELAAWIIGPQSIKPGTKMPATKLPDQSLKALVAYLESLK